MMDHETLISSLDPQDRATLTERSDREGLLHLMASIGALIITASWIAFALPLWPLVLVLHGIFLVFLFTLEHECTHQTPFKTAWLNEVIGRLCGVLLFLPFLWFRYFHMAHHRYTNDPERDPELADPGRPETRRAYALYMSGWGYWKGTTRALWTCALGRIEADYLPVKRRGQMAWEARAMLVLYAFALLSMPKIVFWYWLLPLALGMPFLRLYLLAEHGHCPQVANMLENTRTTLTNRIVRFVAWNMPYHAEHHAYPAVPFHKLPAFHDLTRAHLKSTADGYLNFTESYVRKLE